MTDPTTIEAAIKPNTRMIWIESPSNPLLKLVDLAAVAAIARKHKLIAVADNTFATPYVQRPLDHGFDLVVHSVTKYLNGHSDMVGGMVVVRESGELAEKLAFLHNAVGSILGPFDSFLAMRGLKTLHLRMQRHCESALAIAQWLATHAKVERRCITRGWHRIRNTRWRNCRCTDSAAWSRSFSRETLRRRGAFLSA
jgi:cystathionine beta-lyase/cystathionine gamma-synthase